MSECEWSDADWDDDEEWMETGIWFAMLGNKDLYPSERAWELAQLTAAFCDTLEDTRTPFIDMLRREMC